MNPNPIEQAIEARALRLAEGRLEYEQGTYEWSIAADIMLRECAAALSALRDVVKQEPVAWRVPVTTKHWNGTVSHTYQFRDVKCSEFDEPLYTTPQTPKAEPVLLSDAEIDAISLKQWGDRVLLAAYRTYGRAVEAAVLRRQEAAK